jgi:YD repeat-containing protein
MNYTYDQDNWLYKVTVSGETTPAAIYGYDSAGNRASLTRENGVTTTYTYDSLNRLTNLTNKLGATTVSSYAYALNADGTRSSVTDGSGTTN